MKKVVFLVIFLTFLSCKKEATEPFGKPVQTGDKTATSSIDLGKTIFEGKGMCINCHKTDAKIVGPSLQDIAQIYKEKNGNLLAFLKEEAAPIVDPSQYEIMKSNFSITKTLSKEELHGLETYINSFGK